MYVKMETDQIYAERKMEVLWKRKDSGQKPQVNKLNQERIFKMQMSSWPSPSFLNRDLTITETNFGSGRYFASWHQLKHGFIHFNQSVLTDKNIVTRKRSPRLTLLTNQCWHGEQCYQISGCESVSVRMSSDPRELHWARCCAGHLWSQRALDRQVHSMK